MMMNDFYFSHGNKKLVSNDHVSFYVWSLPAIVTCPFSTELCRKNCYAIKAERQYPKCLESRQRNYEFAKHPDFSLHIIKYFQAELLKKRNAGKQVIVRIHESGDFFDELYFSHWLDIANALPQVLFMAYTKSIAFIHDLPDNFVVRFSLWDDTAFDDRIQAIERHMPVYTACKPDEWDKLPPVNQCHCKDCGHCLKCYGRDIINIACKIH